MTLVKSTARLAQHWLQVLFDPRRILGIASLPRYLADWWHYIRLAGSDVADWHESYPCLTDWLPYTPFDPHYFYQACWAARKLVSRPQRLHVDVGSSIAMVGVISALAPTVFVDYRPLQTTVDGLLPIGGDIRYLPFADACLSSLSCLHVIEHIGLGRYGDRLDPRGSERAARELTRVLAPGGRLLLSTPIGRERVQFNAHRVFAPQTVLNLFEGCELVDFAAVDDDRRFHARAVPAQMAKLDYACGLFEFIKRA